MRHTDTLRRCSSCSVRHSAAVHLRAIKGAWQQARPGVLCTDGWDGKCQRRSPRHDYGQHGALGQQLWLPCQWGLAAGSLQSATHMACRLRKCCGRSWRPPLQLRAARDAAATPLTVDWKSIKEAAACITPRRAVPCRAAQLRQGACPHLHTCIAACLQLSPKADVTSTRHSFVRCLQSNSLLGSSSGASCTYTLAHLTPRNCQWQGMSTLHCAQKGANVLRHTFRPCMHACTCRQSAVLSVHTPKHAPSSTAQLFARVLNAREGTRHVS